MGGANIPESGDWDPIHVVDPRSPAAIETCPKTIAAVVMIYIIEPRPATQLSWKERM